MITYLKGIVHSTGEKSIILLVNDVGYNLLTPKPEIFPHTTKAELFIYSHWNTDRGTTLYGFASELDKTVFLMIIDCQKIGPSIGLQILSQLDALTFLEVIAAQNSKALSSLHGIGPKKAEGIVLELKNKATKLLASGTISTTSIDGKNSGASRALPEVSEALLSLGYSKQEISQTLSFLAQNNGAGNSFDQLLRMGLSYISKNKM